MKQEETNVVSIFKIEEETDWRQPLIEYIQYGILPTDPKKRVDPKCRALRFTLKMTSYIGKLLRGYYLDACQGRKQLTS